MMDLFNCHDWSIGAPYIKVYFNNNYDLNFNTQLHANLITISPSACDSRLTVSLSGDAFNAHYRIVHILVTFPTEPTIEWVHFGKVRLISKDSAPNEMCIESSGGNVFSLKSWNECMLPYTDSLGSFIESEDHMSSEDGLLVSSLSPSSIYSRNSKTGKVQTTTLFSSTMLHVHNPSDTPVDEKITPIVFLSLLVLSLG